MDYLEIGKIINTQGLKGEVKIFPYTEEPERFKNLKNLKVFHKDDFDILSVENVRFHKQMVIIKFKSINTIEEAEKLKGRLLKVTREEALPLSTDEYYAKDLYDMEVFTEDGEFLGILDDIIETGANDVYSVKKENTKDLLIPAIKKCILKVDIVEKKMLVKLLEGLR